MIHSFDDSMMVLIFDWISRRASFSHVVGSQHVLVDVQNEREIMMDTVCWQDFPSLFCFPRGGGLANH
jgi:hypothetical protein